MGDLIEFFENEDYFLEDKLRLLYIVFSNLEKISEPEFDALTQSVKKTFEKQRTSTFKGKL
jgi:hypothetical protein